MALLQLLWLRRMIRRHMKPIAQADAAVWKKRLSVVYMIAAWNAFGIVCYMIFTGRSDWAEYYGYKEKAGGTSAQQWSKTLGLKEATVYKISGFNVKKYQVRDGVFVNEDEQQQQQEQQGETPAPPSET